MHGNTHTPIHAECHTHTRAYTYYCLILMHTRQTTLPQLCISPCFGEGAKLSLATNAKVPQRDPISEAHYQIYNASVTQGQISAMQQYNLR